MDDRALVDGLLAQSADAWGEFDRAIKSRLLHMFASKGVAAQDRIDCYHDFCIRLIERDGRRLRQWRGEASLATWLISAARNHAVDWVRRVQQHLAEQVGHDDSVDAAIDPAFVADPPNPETTATTQQLVERLRRAFDDLPPQERRVAHLLFVDASSPQDIAGALGITTNNVYQIRHRVQEKLRDVLNPSAGRRDGGGVT
jgi:RNA polymerase sigma factor (sigma-70 family)